jgi:uncharacterized protein (UPF0212 family)
MGMYDEIKFKTNCPNCNAEVNSFQSKDGACNLEKLNYCEVDRFYTICKNCEAWIEYSIEQRPYLPIEHYKMTYRVKNSQAQG